MWASNKSILIAQFSIDDSLFCLLILLLVSSLLVMKCFRFILMVISCGVLWVQGQDAEPKVAAQFMMPLDIPDDGVRVSVLGYHDFSGSEPETAMRIGVEKFRKQMQTLKDLDIPVISMADFVAWKDEGKAIPERSVVITIDDGWKSVYTDAFPVLKEFGYPFTIYLYKDYVDGGGKALTTDMILEMMQNGATIGCHSASHPYPQTVKKNRRKGREAFQGFLEVEMGQSKRFLEQTFRVPVKTYAYPGGFFTEEMVKSAPEFGYSHLFTVQPGKVKRSLPNGILPRYIILGNYDRIFEFATTFRAKGGVNSGAVGAGGVSQVREMAYPVEPMPGALINQRRPEIRVNFSAAEDIDVATLEMQVAGFGKVPATYSNEEKVFSWKVNRRLRHKTCEVIVRWKDTSGKAVDKPLRWTFRIDQGAAYLPDE